MTTVLVDLRISTRTGEDVPAETTMYWEPVQRRDTDTYTVLPDPFELPLEATPATVTVAPGYWKVYEGHPAGRLRYLLVLEDSETVLYQNLVEIDPATLGPTEALIPAWEAATSDALTAASDLQAIIGSLKLSTANFAAQLQNGIN